jgi:hypothetical protein
MNLDSGLATVMSAVVAAIAAIVVAKINKGSKARKVLAKAKGSLEKPTTGQSVSGAFNASRSATPRRGVGAARGSVRTCC